MRTSSPSLAPVAVRIDDERVGVVDAALLAIGQIVAIRVVQERIGARRQDLEAVVQPVVVGIEVARPRSVHEDLVAVLEAVVVGVGVVRIRAVDVVLVVVREAVAVAIVVARVAVTVAVSVRLRRVGDDAAVVDRIEVAVAVAVEIPEVGRAVPVGVHVRLVHVVGAVVVAVRVERVNRAVAVGVLGKRRHARLVGVVDPVGVRVVDGRVRSETRLRRVREAVTVRVGIRPFDRHVVEHEIVGVGRHVAVPVVVADEPDQPGRERQEVRVRDGLVRGPRERAVAVDVEAALDDAAVRLESHPVHVCARERVRRAPDPVVVERARARGVDAVEVEPVRHRLAVVVAVGLPVVVELAHVVALGARVPDHRARIRRRPSSRDRTQSRRWSSCSRP